MGPDIGPDIIVPVSMFAMVVGIVYISVSSGTKRRQAALKVVEEAIRGGQTLTPETIRALGMPRKNSNGDLKAGLILLAVAASFLVLGWAIGSSSGDEEVMFIMPAVASFPGFIGAVLVGFGLMGRKKDEQDAA
jgi:hypothetical protein